jgi:hypothetical protein
MKNTRGKTLSETLTGEEDELPEELDHLIGETKSD